MDLEHRIIEDCFNFEMITGIMPDTLYVGRRELDTLVKLVDFYGGIISLGFSNSQRAPILKFRGMTVIEVKQDSHLRVSADPERIFRRSRGIG